VRGGKERKTLRSAEQLYSVTENKMEKEGKGKKVEPKKKQEKMKRMRGKIRE